MIRKAFSYKKWADERTLEAIGRLDEESHPESCAFVLQQMNHMVIVEELFRSRLTGHPAPHDSTNTANIPPMEELQRRLAESNEWYCHHVTALDSENLQREISFTFTDGKHGSMSMEEILFHVVNHGSYHRGAMAHALDLAGVAHPVDGYGIFIHEEEPWRREPV